MDEPTCSIYGLCDPRVEPTLANVRYVGKSVNVKLRLRKHTEHARRGDDTYKARWIRTLLAADLKPIAIVLATVDDDGAGAAERAWIERARAAGCILTNTAEGGLGGRTLTDEARSARAEAMRERWADPAYRERMSKAHRGKTLSPEARRLVSEAGKKVWSADPARKERHIASRLGKPGRPMTDELRAKISASLTGKPWSEAKRRSHEARGAS